LPSSFVTPLAKAKRKRPAKSCVLPMLLPLRSVVMRKTTGIPAMHVRKVRGAHAPCGLTLAPLLLAYSPYPVAIPQRSRWLFGGCHAFMPGETQKPRQPPGFGVSCCLQRGQAISPPPLRRLFNPALYRRRHAACRGKASAPPASLKSVGASLQSPLRFQPWRTAQQQHIPGGHGKS
jgi:hypothetical protein